MCRAADPHGDNDQHEKKRGDHGAPHLGWLGAGDRPVVLAHCRLALQDPKRRRTHRRVSLTSGLHLGPPAAASMFLTGGVLHLLSEPAD
jgi:hypothetical protein